MFPERPIFGLEKHFDALRRAHDPDPQGSAGAKSAPAFRKDDAQTKGAP